MENNIYILNKINETYENNILIQQLRLKNLIEEKYFINLAFDSIKNQLSLVSEFGYNLDSITLSELDIINKEITFNITFNLIEKLFPFKLINFIGYKKTKKEYKNIKDILNLKNEIENDLKNSCGLEFNINFNSLVLHNENDKNKLVTKLKINL